VVILILGEVFPGENAEILVEAIKTDYSGEDIDGITNPVVYVKQYKQTEELATGATAVYNSNMGQYLVTIPAAYIPSSGIFDFVLKGDDIADVLGRIQVNTASAQLTSLLSGGAIAEKVIPATNYTFDASEKTITLTGDYATTTLEQIIEIRNITKGKLIIYDCTKSSSEITIAAGVISYTEDFAYQGTAFEDTDTLQITINKVE